MIAANTPEYNLESLPMWAQELIKQLSTQVQQLTARVHELESQLAKNSTNSGKPPSSDGLKRPPKTQSLRGKSGKKPGGQVGRKGNTLLPVEAPDDVQIHSPITCMGCQGSLEEVEAVSVDKRQVFDLPPIAMTVTEHQAQTKICPCCGVRNKGTFPENLNAPVQYGERIKALAAYFLHQHFIPFERVVQIFEDVFDMAISPGTCANMNKRLFKNLEIFEASLKAYLLVCSVLHLDETGLRCEKKLHWIHVTSSNTATFYGLHGKRGCEAVEAIGILPKYTGNVIHDHWHCYFSYQQVKHGLCNVHHLRELRYIYEEEQSAWAKSMADLLLKGKKMADQARIESKASLTPEEIASIEGEFVSILLGVASTYLAAAEDEHPQESVGKQGFNLFRRFLKKMDEVLYFVRDLSIPFSNNLAEQDLRMEKVKQKISGCFRTFCGGVISCRVRSYISTARKQGWGIIDSLTEAIRGSPRMLHS